MRLFFQPSTTTRMESSVVVKKIVLLFTERFVKLIPDLVSEIIISYPGHALW